MSPSLKQLTGQADLTRPAVAEHLHTRCGDAEAVGIVPMELERGCGWVYRCALDAGRARPEPDRVADRVAARLAESFKTVGIEAT